MYSAIAMLLLMVVVVVCNAHAARLLRTCLDSFAVSFVELQHSTHFRQRCVPRVGAGEGQSVTSDVNLTAVYQWEK
jgi:hypothetical protein